MRRTKNKYSYFVLIIALLFTLVACQQITDQADPSPSAPFQEGPNSITVKDPSTSNEQHYSSSRKDLNNHEIDIEKYRVEEKQRKVLESNNLEADKQENEKEGIIFDNQEKSNQSTKESTKESTQQSTQQSTYQVDKEKQKDNYHDQQQEIKEKPSAPSTPPKRVALTFDDGPHEQITNQVLNELKKREAKATFFVLGHLVKEHPDIMKRIVQEQHEIGNHTWSHSKLTMIPIVEVEQEISRSSAAVQEVAGITPTIVRPPFGIFNETITQSLQLPIVTWSVDSLDWQNRQKESIVKEVLNNVHDGAIVLLHDIYPSTLEALPEILDSLKEQGYLFVTVSELLGLGAENQQEKAGKVYSSQR